MSSTPCNRAADAAAGLALVTERFGAGVPRFGSSVTDTGTTSGGIVTAGRVDGLDARQGGPRGGDPSRVVGAE